MHMVMASAEFF